MAPVSDLSSPWVFFSQEDNQASCSSSQASSVASEFPPDWNHPSETDFHQISELYQKKKTEFSEGFFSLKVNKRRYELVSYTDKKKLENVRFIVLKELYCSDLSTVCIAVNLINREIVVLKLIPDDALGKKELEVYEKLDSIEKVRTYCVIGPRFKCKDTIGLILPYLNKGDLLSYYNNVLGKDRVLFNKIFYPLLFQMASALAFLHEHDIVHLDVKLENYLVDDGGNVFLTDFGFSSFSGDDLKSVKGSPGYIDPFFFKEPVPKSVKYNPASDCWSLGVCFSILTCGSGFQNWTRQMDEGDYEYLGNMSERRFERKKSRFNFDRLTDQLLRLPPEKRITARKAADEMSKLINSSVKLKA